jgi:hypothetical protein
MRFVHLLVVSGSLLLTGCGTGAPAAGPLPPGRTIWRVDADGNRGTFVLQVDDGEVTALLVSSGAVELDPPVAFQDGQGNVLINFVVTADPLNRGVAEPTRFLIGAWPQPNGTFRGTWSIDVLSTPVEDSREPCTVRTVPAP